jgi:hypothetical protein
MEGYSPALAGQEAEGSISQEPEKATCFSAVEEAEPPGTRRARERVLLGILIDLCPKIIDKESGGRTIATGASRIFSGRRRNSPGDGVVGGSPVTTEASSEMYQMAHFAQRAWT